MIAGVAAAIGERFDIPVPLVRVAFVVLSFFGGFGVLAYLVGWLLIPEQGQDTPIAGALFENTETVTSWLGVGLIIAAALVALSWTNLVRGDFLIAAALLGVGILLFRGDIGGSSKTKVAPARTEGDGSDSSSAVGDTAVDDTAVDGTESSGGDDDVPATPPATAATGTAAMAAGGEAEPPQSPTPAPPPPPPPHRRERSMLGGLTFGAILLTVGIMAALDAAGLTRPSFHHYVAAIVIAAGGGLLVGTLWGKSYGLIAVGLLLLPVLAVSTLVRVPFGGDIGERIVQPVVVEEIVSPVEMAIGDLTIDLRRLERGEPVELNAEVGIGQITVFVPADRTTTVEAEIGIGSLNLFGDQSAGLGRDVKTAWPGDNAGDPIHLNLQAGIGEIRVVVTEI